MQSDIVIVGGGAGGLELACKLGRKLGPAKVTLVDSRLYHVWKPSLHEVAAGTLDIHQEGLSFQMLAHDHGFTYVYGALSALDPARKCLTVGAISTETQEQLMPERELNFGALVLAVGSTSNYFGVPGAMEHTISLNATEDAERFRLTLLKLLTMAAMDQGRRAAGIDIVIIGGGATGVELAAELREASGVYASYGQWAQAPTEVRITLLEGGPRILAPLPERLAEAAMKLLRGRDIAVVTDCRVTAIDADQVSAASGATYRANLCVWAAGIKAPAILATLGLPTNRGGQLEVDGHLRVRGFPDIYALGDCAGCTGADGTLVPPRAQAAHQQAAYLVKAFLRRQAGKQEPDAPYAYRDYGSLVSFGHATTVGTLMGSLKGLSWFVEGFFARMMYVSLHLLHHQAVLGTGRTAVLALARFLIKRAKPLVKLH